MVSKHLLLCDCDLGCVVTGHMVPAILEAILPLQAIRIASSARLNQVLQWQSGCTCLVQVGMKGSICYWFCRRT